jgi:hypothetical protein
VGGEARKTNYDYTHGALGELIDITIEEGAKVFITAVGVPPRWVVEKLHSAGILVMNMVGSPKHVPKALAVRALPSSFFLFIPSLSSFLFFPFSFPFSFP